MTVLTNKEDIFKELEIFGRYQIFQYFLICLPLCVLSMTMSNYIFVAEEVDYRCEIPECETVDTILNTSVRWVPDFDAKCLKPIVKDNVNGSCNNSTFTEKWEECHQWIYDNNNSIVSELNLACQPWKASLVGSVHNSAMIASAILAGVISDKIGRKPTIIVCSIGGAIGILKIFITNYYGYLFVEFVESFFSSGLLTVAVVLMLEIGGDTKRVITGVIFSYAYYVGEIIFAFSAMYLQYWKYLILFANGPFLLFILYGFILRESTRWQMLRSKTKEAKINFKVQAKMNKLNLTDDEIDNISDDELRRNLNVEIQLEKESLNEIIHSRQMVIRLLITSVCFFTSGFIYCGLVVHSVLMPGNKYTNFALASAASFPGDLLAYYTFMKFGRKVTLQCGYFASALFILAQAFVSDSLYSLKLILFLFGKFGTVVCFTGIYTYSLELFPTSVRGSLVGFGNTAARIGSMLAPLTPLLKSQLAILPAVLFASMAAMAGALLIFTPETKTLPLFDTIAQVDEYTYTTKKNSKE